MDVQCIGKGLRNIQMRVLHLDDTVHTFNLSVHATGLELYASMVERIRLLEADYFDLEFVNDDGMRCWLDHEKPILRQLSPGKELIFRFGVKFYTPHPNLLEEEFTRYLFALQIKRDLVSGTLLCSENTAALLASYIVQAEIGDFIEDEYRTITYLRPLKLLHEPTDVRLGRIMEYHKSHIGMSPTEADFALLDTARKVEFYGVRLHFARDNDGLGLNLAVTHLGVLVFQNLIRINTLSWAKIRKLSFKRRRFLIKLHADRYDSIEFIFDSREECKLFWKNCIEHHTFFRCPMVPRDPQKRGSIASAGSSFRYIGRTQQELAEYVKRHGEYRTNFQRPSAARRANPNALTGLHYPSRRLNSASMQLRSSSADRRSFLLKNMGASLSGGTLGKQPALKRAQSMAAGALGREDDDRVSSSSDGPRIMTTSGYATMAGSAGSAQSAEAKDSTEQVPEWSESQEPEDGAVVRESHWVSESHRRMTGDWTGNGVRLDSAIESDRRAKSATGSPRTSAAASLTRLNTQLDQLLQFHSVGSESNGIGFGDSITTGARIEQVTFERDGGPIYSQPNEDSPQKQLPEPSVQYALVPVQSTPTEPLTTYQSESSPLVQYHEVADSIRLDMHTTTFPGTSTVTYSNSTRTMISSEPLTHDSGRTTSQTALVIAQPDVISQTDGLHLQSIAAEAREESALNESSMQPRTLASSMTTFLTDASTSLRMDQSGPTEEYSVAAALLGSPEASSRLGRDTLPSMLGQIEFRAQDGLFILPTVTQFGLEINMDRQQVRAMDSTRQTLLPGITTSPNTEVVYTMQTGNVIDTVMHWYTQPDTTVISKWPVTTAAANTMSYGTFSTADQSVKCPASHPRTAGTTESLTYTLNSNGFPKTDVSSVIASRATELPIAVGEAYSATTTLSQAVQTQSPVTEQLTAAASVDQWSSSGSDSTTGVILRPDSGSGLTRVTQHSTGCLHATSKQTQHQSGQNLPISIAISNTENIMHSKAYSTTLASNSNSGPTTVLPLNTLPCRHSARSKQTVHAHTCARGHKLSQSIPCGVHLSGVLDSGPTNAHVSAAPIEPTSLHLVSTPGNPSGSDRRRTKESTESEAKRISRRAIDSGNKQTELMAADMVLLNGINAATDMLEEVPYVVMRRPRSVDVKQYQMHLQRQQQQAAALAAAAAGYPLHSSGAHHTSVFPAGDNPYPYGSRVPMMQPQLAYAPMMPSSGAYPSPGLSHPREHSGATRKSGRRATGSSGSAGLSGTPGPSSALMSVYPEAYYHGIRHGMMPFEGGYPVVPPGPYMERVKCKAKRKHSKSRVEAEKMGEEQTSRTGKSISHMPASVLSSSSTAVPHRHLDQSQHHIHCAHRQSSDMTSVFTAQPRPIAHSRRHPHPRSETGSRRITGETPVSSGGPVSGTVSVKRADGTDRARRGDGQATTPSSTSATKSELVGGRGRKMPPEPDDGREMEVPYPVSELFVSPSRNMQPDDIRIAKERAGRRHHHHHHHPACASLMGRVKAQLQGDSRQSDPSSIQPTGTEARVSKSKTRSSSSTAVVVARSIDKSSRPIPSSDVLDVATSREGATESDQLSRDTRETIEKLREELRSAGFQVKDSQHALTTAVSLSGDSGHYKTTQVSSTKVAPAKKSTTSKASSKAATSQARTASSLSQLEPTTDQTKGSSGEQRTMHKLESFGSKEPRSGSGLDVSFGGPPQNPIYLDSDSDSIEVTASQTKDKLKPSTAESHTTTTSKALEGSPQTNIAPVETTASSSTAVESKLVELEARAESAEVASTEGFVKDDHTTHDTADEMLPFGPSPRSHSPSLPLSFPLSEFDGTEASVISSEVNSLASGSSDYSRRSSECECLSNDSMTSVSSCSYCCDHRQGYRDPHRYHGHHYPGHHHRHHHYHHHHHPERYYYGSVSRSTCHCYMCLSAASERKHRRRHHSDHRESCRHRKRHASQSQRHDIRPHSEKPRHPASQRSHSHRSATSSYHRHKHGRCFYRHRDYHVAGWSRTPSSRESLSDHHSDRSNSEDSFDLGSSPAESPSNSVDHTHQAMLNQLRQQERELRAELAKHRALASQLKEAQKRTHKLLHPGPSEMEEPTKRTLHRISHPNTEAETSRIRTKENGIKNEENESSLVHRRPSRRRAKTDGAVGVVGSERKMPETPSTSRSSDRIRVVRRSSAGRKKRDGDSKQKGTVSQRPTSAILTTTDEIVGEPKVDQLRSGSTGRREHHRHVLSESHVRHRRPTYRSGHGFKRITKSTTDHADSEGKDQKRIDQTGAESRKETNIKPYDESKKLAYESDILVIANKGALSSTEEDQTTRIGDTVASKAAPLEPVQEVCVPVETQPIPTRAPWDDHEEDETMGQEERIASKAAESDQLNTMADRPEKSDVSSSVHVGVIPQTTPKQTTDEKSFEAEPKEQRSLRSSFNRLTDTPDESVEGNAEEDLEYNGTRIPVILSDGLSRLPDAPSDALEQLSQDFAPDYGDRTGASTDGSNTMSGGDETHTSEASVDTVKPAHRSRDPSPTSSTTSASEGSEDIEPFPSPPPETATIDSFQDRTSPLIHSHLLLPTGLDEVIEEEAGTSELESEAAAAAAAIAVLDAATSFAEAVIQKEEEEEEEDDDEEEEETSNVTVIARDPNEPLASFETSISEREDVIRPTDFPEPALKADVTDKDKTPTEDEKPLDDWNSSMDTTTTDYCTQGAVALEGVHDEAEVIPDIPNRQVEVELPDQLSNFVSSTISQTAESKTSVTSDQEFTIGDRFDQSVNNEEVILLEAEGGKEENVERHETILEQPDNEQVEQDCGQSCEQSGTNDTNSTAVNELRTEEQTEQQPAINNLGQAPDIPLSHNFQPISDARPETSSETETPEQQDSQLNIVGEAAADLSDEQMIRENQTNSTEST